MRLKVTVRHGHVNDGCPELRRVEVREARAPPPRRDARRSRPRPRAQPEDRRRPSRRGRAARKGARISTAARRPRRTRPPPTCSSTSSSVRSSAVATRSSTSRGVARRAAEPRACPGRGDRAVTPPYGRRLTGVPLPHDPGPHWGEVGIHGLHRQREWDDLRTVEAAGLVGDELWFVALADGRTILEEGEDDPGPLAAAVGLEPPYRAHADPASRSSLGRGREPHRGRGAERRPGRQRARARVERRRADRADRRHADPRGHPRARASRRLAALDVRRHRDASRRAPCGTWPWRRCRPAQGSGPPRQLTAVPFAHAEPHASVEKSGCRPGTGRESSAGACPRRSRRDANAPESPSRTRAVPGGSRGGLEPAGRATVVAPTRTSAPVCTIAPGSASSTAVTVSGS